VDEPKEDAADQSKIEKMVSSSANVTSQKFYLIEEK
jgi:hypothetical protein